MTFPGWDAHLDRRLQGLVSEEWLSFPQSTLTGGVTPQVASEGEGLWEKKAAQMGQGHSRKQVSSRWYKLSRGMISPGAKPTRKRGRVAEPEGLNTALHAYAWRGVCHVGSLHTGVWNGVCVGGQASPPGSTVDVTMAETSWITRLRAQCQHERNERIMLLKRTEQSCSPWRCSFQISHEQDPVLLYWCKPEAITRLGKAWKAVHVQTHTGHGFDPVLAENVWDVAQEAADGTPTGVTNKVLVPNDLAHSEEELSEQEEHCCSGVWLQDDGWWPRDPDKYNSHIARSNDASSSTSKHNEGAGFTRGQSSKGPWTHSEDDKLRVLVCQVLL